jgi:hypothetical protein
MRPEAVQRPSLPGPVGGLDVDAPLGEPVEQLDRQLTIQRRRGDDLRDRRIEAIDALGDAPGRQGGNDADVTNALQRYAPVAPPLRIA